MTICKYVFNWFVIIIVAVRFVFFSLAVVVVVFRFVILLFLILPVLQVMHISNYILYEYISH